MANPARKETAASAESMEDLTLFHELEKETMKLDRSVIHQEESIARLRKLKAKLEAKKEKEQAKSVHLDAQCQSAFSNIKSMKENLKGKRTNRIMMEEMVVNLERQLKLEKIDTENKLKGFKQTQQKYDDMWKNYEAVYNKMPHVMESAKAQEEYEAALKVTETLQAEIEIKRAEIAKIQLENESSYKKCAVLLAKHYEVQKLQSEVSECKGKLKTLNAEVEKLQADLKKAEALHTEKLEKNQKNVRITNKLRDLMQTLATNNESLQVMEFQHLSFHEPAPECQESTLFDTGSEFDEIRMDEEFEINSDAPAESLQTSFSTVEPVAEMQSAPEACPTKIQKEKPTDANEPMVVEQTLENNVDVAPPEPVVEKEPELMQVTPVVDVNPTTVDQPPILSQPIATGTEPESMTQEESEPCSQVTMAPVDGLAEQQMAFGGSAPNVAIAPVPAWDEFENQNDNLSQDTASTTGSMGMLLDDERRLEFMRRIMSSPTISNAPSAEEPSGGVVQRSPKSAGTDHGYLQNFYNQLSSGNGGTADPNASHTSMPAPPVPENAPVSSNTGFAPASGDQNNFRFPQAPAENPPDDAFGGFSSFFGGTTAPANNAVGFFGGGFGGGPTEDTSQQPNSAFSFSFGGPPSNNSSSFMNLF